MDDDSPARRTEVDSLDLASATSLRDPLMALARRMRRQRPDHQLPLTQVQVLSDLARGGPLTPVELAAHERVRPQSLTPAVNALEADGLLTKRSDPTDGRRQLLELTPAGEALVAAHLQIAVDLLDLSIDQSVG